MHPEPSTPESSPVDGPLRPGQKFLGKYEIREQIGKGGFSRVYHAHYPWGRRDVAIKVLYRDSGLTDELLYRGQTEARVLMNELRHPNIVEVTDAGVDDGLLYIIMELLRGRTLRHALNAHRRLTLVEALDLFATIASTVSFAHDKGVIHRDLKPENLFVTAGNVPKVLDFGIAKIMGPNAWQTQKNMVLGTTLYISPEQVMGHGASPRSDIYAIGTMLFEALLGRHPCLLENDSLDPRVLARVQVKYQPKRLDELDPAIPSHVARIVHQAISKQPSQRFASMKELEWALREALGRHLRESGLDRSDVRDLSRSSSLPEAPSLAHAMAAASGAPTRTAAAKATAGVPDTAIDSRPAFEKQGKHTLPGVAPAPPTSDRPPPPDPDMVPTRSQKIPAAPRVPRLGPEPTHRIQVPTTSSPTTTRLQAPSAPTEDLGSAHARQAWKVPLIVAATAAFGVFTGAVVAYFFSPQSPEGDAVTQPVATIDSLRAQVPQAVVPQAAPPTPTSVARAVAPSSEPHAEEEIEKREETVPVSANEKAGRNEDTAEAATAKAADSAAEKRARAPSTTMAGTQKSTPTKRSDFVGNPPPRPTEKSTKPSSEKHASPTLPASGLGEAPKSTGLKPRFEPWITE